MNESIKSYAKINLSLKVVKKTKSGYHKLQMIMALIDLYDVIVFEECDDIVVEMNKELCAMKDNLCYKVACYLKQKFKVEKGIKITIEKNIPDGSGLGGGSSNAAEVLKFLNNYWGLKLNRRKLRKIGFKFGCDIPFFIDGIPSLVGGFGEKIKHIRIKEEIKELYLGVPDFSLKTADVFKCFAENDSKKIENIGTIMKTWDIKLFFNDLQRAADRVSSGKIEELIGKVNGTINGKCIMSGAGSSLLVFGDDLKKEKLFEVAPSVKWNRHTLIK